MTFKHVRILLLLAVLLAAAGLRAWDRHVVTSWQSPLTVVIFPIRGDDSAEIAKYVQKLDRARFAPVGDFIQQQGARFSGRLFPLPDISLGKEIAELPPARPARQSVSGNMLWSLKLRYYALRQSGFSLRPGVIRIFVIYHQGEEGKALDHSLGIRDGLIGVVHAFGLPKQDAQNNVVMTHELLHTLGATDKYGAQNMPVYPEGFAEVKDSPQYPQRMAEIMAGRIPLSATRARMPSGLEECVIGYKTAYEIHW
ncbi:MAG: hypothetical protein Q8O37_11525 [Sulfuricellaceae bacterium]|nr:hypothetical protein [Sulfuricellaceae bacterium]